jgi:hypothetical protein
MESNNKISNLSWNVTVLQRFFGTLLNMNAEVKPKYTDNKYHILGQVT